MIFWGNDVGNLEFSIWVKWAELGTLILASISAESFHLFLGGGDFLWLICSFSSDILLGFFTLKLSFAKRLDFYPFCFMVH